MTDTKARQTDDERRLRECEEVLGHRFTDRGLLALALTHSSLRDEWTESNERLEFLGDSVLGLCVAEHLFCTFPGFPEGTLTRVRSRVVSREPLARVARRLHLRRFLRVGKGIRRSRTVPPSLLADALEAMVGAIYLDGGFEVVRAKVLEWLADDLDDAASAQRVINHKAALQQVTQRLYGCTPRYLVLEASGPDHDKQFEVAAEVTDRQYPPGKGSTKKQAEQRAARNALRDLKREHGPGFPGVPVA